jgi:hypothetical protein
LAFDFKYLICSYKPCQKKKSMMFKKKKRLKIKNKQHSPSQTAIPAQHTVWLLPLTPSIPRKVP